MNYKEYWKEIAELAESCIQEAIEDGAKSEDDIWDRVYDWILYETVGDHEWVIYYSHNLDVVGHSDNEEYMLDNFGPESIVEALADGGLSSLHCAIAFWCMYADVADYPDVACDICEAVNHLG